MRAVLVAAILLATLVPTPGAAAASFAEDASGDAQLRVFGLGPGAPAPGGPGAAADLLALEIMENAEDLTFVLKVADLKQTVTFSSYRITFDWNKDEYEITVRRTVLPGVTDDSSSASLYASDEDGDFNDFAWLEHEIDLDAGLITVHLPKAYILGDNGRFPLLGDALEDLRVEGRSHFTLFDFASDAYDRMPDGEEMLTYNMLYGDLASGHLRLDAPERVRVSNGGATTFVYQATVINKGEVDDEVALTLTEMPEGWNGTVHSPLRVPAGAERRIAVIMSVPFAHEHGGFSSFNLTATSAENANAVASIRMGVLHTPIPQPAGHHAELYLHAKNFNSGLIGAVFPFSQASMNTESAHDGDPEEIEADRVGDGIGWRIPLDPMLRMGLDFDIDRLGELAGSVVGNTRSSGSLHAELYLTTPDGEDSILIGETDSIDITLDLSTPTPFKLVFTPNEEADYIPYLRGQNLVMLLAYDEGEEGGDICCVPGATPTLLTADFKLSLPLNEYHDKLSALSDGDLLTLKATGEIEKAGLPGATMTYVFTLTNNGKDEEVIEVDLAGTDASLGMLVPSGAVTLASKESRTITLAVGVPTGRNEGEQIEVLIFAYAQDDPSKSAIARTKTTIAKAGADDIVSDETGVLLAAQQAEDNDTPLGGTIVALAAVALAALAMRRRRA